MSEHIVMISGDAHIGSFVGNWWGAENYIDPEYREQYLEQERANPPHSWTPDELGFLQPAPGAGGLGGSTSEGVHEMYVRRMDFVREKIGDPVDAGKMVTGFATSGDMDSEYRLKELEADGVVGDVVFPQGNPFFPTMRTHGGHPFNPVDELGAAGRRAVNRWLADFVTENPERHAVPVVCDVNDIEQCVKDIHWGKEHGLRGGFAPVQQGSPDLFGLPLWNDPYYYPIWEACNELEYPVSMHIGAPTNPMGGPGTPGLMAMEYFWLGRRPLRYMIMGGVFERFPKLRLLLSEATATWVIDELRDMDAVFRGELLSSIKSEEAMVRDGMDFSDQRGDLTRLPSEYFAEQCFLNTGSWHTDWERRRSQGYDITDNMVWGNDYPHPEGTWPTSVQQLTETFARVDVDQADIRKILGGNAARLYGFDLDVLQPIADRVGPVFTTAS
jgi:predicted TIM-barrel fold metal-dependent hydrolase